MKKKKPFLSCVFVISLSVPSVGQLPNPSADQQRECFPGSLPTARCVISPATHEFVIQLPYQSAWIPITVVFTHTWPGVGNPPPQKRRRSCGERAPPVVCEYQGIGSRRKERNLGREGSGPFCKLTMDDHGRCVKLSFCSEAQFKKSNAPC